MRKLILVAVLFLAGLLPGRGLASAPVDVGFLTADSTLFWDGGYVTSSATYSLPHVSSNTNLDRCAHLEPCFKFQFRVLDIADRLRVALDTPMRDDGFEITYTSPTGVVTRRSNPNQYSVENFFNSPATGVWTIKVAPYSAEYASFRMRAKLESSAYTPPVPVDTNDLLPNLRATRLWEFGFVAPANPTNGRFPPDDQNPPLEVAGQHPLSCGVDETLEEGTSRCLRFSFGLANVGDGNFDVRFNGDRLAESFPMTQCVQQVPISPQFTPPPRPVPAGEGVFHKTHGHFHYKDIISHLLYRVTDRSTGDMTEVGVGKKLGYSPADQGIAEWSKFVQAPGGTSGLVGNCVTGTADRLGMSSGWGDAYRYQRPGNFVDFTDGGDGYFVVQTIADPANVVLESKENDNTSYAYLRIVGEEIDVLESGVGLGPWDPGKIVYN